MNQLHNLWVSITLIFQGVIGLITLGFFVPGTAVKSIRLDKEEIDWLNTEYPKCDFYSGKRE